MELKTLLEVSIAALVKSGILIGILLTAFAYMTLTERKFMAFLQVRIGPNRVGPFGFFQPVADGIKLMFKEELIPAGADRILFVLAPIITVVPALVILAVVPFGPPVDICFPATLTIPFEWGACYKVPLAITDVNVGILFITSIASIAVYGIVLAGWSSDNKYAMLGGLRSTAQMVSYEIPLGLTMIPPILLAGSMSLNAITLNQMSLWNVVRQPIGALVFLIAVLAEVNRSPFDMPEAEQELTAGYHTEYSGMKFALFFMAEYIKMIAIAAVGASLFLGGYRGPLVDTYPLLGPVYLLIKVIIWLGVIIWLRATLPRIRYDRLMMLEWKIVFPLSLANVLVTAIVLVLVGGK